MYIPQYAPGLILAGALIFAPCELAYGRCVRASLVLFRFYLDVYCALTLSSIYTSFNTLKKKRKTLWKNVKLLKMSNFTFYHNVFYAICILKSFNSHISVVVCSFFEFGTVSKLCIREWVNCVHSLIFPPRYAFFLLCIMCMNLFFFT